MGFFEFLMWVALLTVLGWAVWQLYLHPESWNSKPAGHSVLEDTTPTR